ncbi:hypothetical protein [Dyadobacter fanqingshengii]|uniref:DUF4175 domain-containing protein n=1 Tax=Dyadobacter fanqingshengii TaxID=2906443 RepID=A0A9X1PBM1_9BACT|nr:hypothetical protein [Dyadobacter fanqingshengii]MCF0041234.1 hypothetical protein [Dyadobacter fanqingshengii]MCF2505659.1 hypothetical protein [Dyadobacter fanqingshengii]USJ37041.1 hypothetical protein NFI81_04530 [Dyadobacter fanqingshengii]
MESTFWKVWRAPLIIGLFSMIGLLSALTGDDLWDVLSWLTLGIPVLIMIRFIPWRKKQVKQRIR